MGMTIHPAHRRMAELWTIGRKRELTQEERTELDQCLAVNAKLCWEMAALENWSLMASLTGDTEWQYDICRQIESLPYQARRPDRERNDPA